MLGDEALHERDHRIVGGDYQRRDQTKRPIGDDFADAAGYYGDRARSMAGQVTDIVKNARDAFSEAFQKRPK